MMDDLLIEDQARLVDWVWRLWPERWVNGAYRRDVEKFLNGMKLTSDEIPLFQIMVTDLHGRYSQFFPYDQIKEVVKKIRATPQIPEKRVEIDYDAYLASPAWQKMRRMVLQAYNYRCALCNAKSKSLDVHHRTYERLGNERLEDLTALCRPCHEIADERRRQARLFSET